MTQKSLFQAAGDGTAVPANYSGETKYHYIKTNTTWIPSNGLFGDITSHVLTAGIWKMYGALGINVGTMTGVYNLAIAMQGIAGNDQTQMIYGINAANIQITDGTTQLAHYANLSVIVLCNGTNITLLDGTVVSATTTLYWKQYMNTFSVAPTFKSVFTATRIA